MGKNEKTPVVINGKQYMYEDLPQEQQAIVNHLADLDRKINSARFNLDQLQVGKGAFMNMLEQSMAALENAVSNASPVAAE